MSRRFLVVIAATAAAVALTGCFDSLVGGRCADGWVAEGEACRPRAGGDGVDAGAPLAAADAAGSDDAPTCGPCPSGICRDGVCVGTAAGHVVLVGHDYLVHHAAAARLLGNAAALGGRPTVRVALLVDDAGDVQILAVERALDAGLDAVGRTWSPVPSSAVGDGDDARVDVVIVLPRAMSAAESYAAGEGWQAALSAFVASGGTVIGLEGPDSSTTDFLRGAALLDATRGGLATGEEVTLVAPTDALATGVPSPYLAARGSTTFGATDGAVVVATSAGAPIVLHAAWPR